MKTSIITISLVLLFFASCTNCKNKSVFESLSENEVIAEMQKDSVFMLIYQEIDKNREKLNNLSFEEKTKYYKITYSDLCKVAKNMNNMSESEYNKYHTQWENEFKDVEKKLDSISSHYRHILDHADANSMIAQHVKFERKYGRYPKSNEELLNSIAPDILVKYWSSLGWLYKDTAIKELVDENYLNESEYFLSKKYPLESQFMKLVFD